MVRPRASLIFARVMEMPNDHLGELSIAKLLAGIAGSFVSLRFMAGTLLQRMTLAVGGAA